MLFTVDVLDVEQHQVGVCHQRFEFGKERLFSGKRLPARVDDGVDALLFCLFKQLQQKIDLQQRFPAADGDAAPAAPVAAVTKGPLQHVFRIGFAVSHLPGVCVVTELTAHRTALQKDDVANARTVDRSEGLDGMQCAFMLSHNCFLL